MVIASAAKQSHRWSRLLPRRYAARRNDKLCYEQPDGTVEPWVTFRWCDSRANFANGTNAANTGSSIRGIRLIRAIREKNCQSIGNNYPHNPKLTSPAKAELCALCWQEFILQPIGSWKEIA
jgi:hypothetical protein